MKLKDIAEVNPRKSEIDKDAVDEVSFVAMADVSEDGFISEHETRPLSEVYSGYTYFKMGDVLLAKITPCFENGKAAIADNIPNEIGFGSSEFHVLRTNGKVLPKYLFYALWNRPFREHGSKKMTGSAGQKRLPTNFLKNHEIPLPSLSEQKAIVAKLDRAQRLIDINKEMLAKYDELIQSVFLEMFGDVFSDKTETPFEDHLDIKHGYAFKSKWFDDEGDVPVVKIGTVNKSTVDFSDVQFLDKSYAEEYERFKIYPGDLLLSMTGTVGKDDYANPCVMTDEYNFYLLNQRVVKLKFDEKVFTKSFLYHFFKQDHIKRELTKFSRGIRQANLSNKDIYGLSFQKPDFEKLLQFEALCEKVEKEKMLLKESTKKSVELFSSLVQGAFG